MPFGLTVTKANCVFLLSLAQVSTSTEIKIPAVTYRYEIDLCLFLQKQTKYLSMKLKFTTLGLVVASLLFSCKKENNCNEATVMLKNTSSTVIHFAYDSKNYNNSIPAGNYVIRKIGPVKNHFYGAEWPTINFFSDHGDHEYLIKTCNVVEDIN